MGQTPCCIHTEQPGWVLAQCAGCHLWEGEKAKLMGITSPRDEPQSAHHSQLSYSLIASTSSWFPTARALSNDSLMRLPTQSDLRPLSVFKKKKKKKKKACEEVNQIQKVIKSNSNK